jgi:hypothetical protein
VTSEYPTPAETAGPDPQDAPYAAASAPFQPGTELTPFSAFGDTSRGDAPAPVAARAAVRMPTGHVTSAPPDTTPPSDQGAGGRVYGRPTSGGSVYGGSASASAEASPAAAQGPSAGAPPGQRSATVYGAQQARAYGQPYAGSPVDAVPMKAQAAPPTQAPARPAVPIQRTSTVYGQRQPAPVEPEWDDEAPAQQYSGPPAQQYSAPPAQQYSAPPAQQYSAPPVQQYSAPPDLQPPVQRAQSPLPPMPSMSPPPQRGPQAPERPQFEQHGRQTQAANFAPSRPFSDDQSFAGDQPRPPAGGWQESDLDAERQSAPARSRVTWQEQLQQPMISTEGSRPEAAPQPVNVIPDMPSQPRSKLRLIGYVAIVVAVIALGVGALYYTSRSSPPAVGSCVKQSGTSAVNVSCSVPGAFKVVKSVTTASACPDYLNEPSLTYESGGKTTVLCLEQTK